MSGRAYRRLLQEREKERMAKEIEAEIASKKGTSSKPISKSSTPRAEEESENEAEQEEEEEEEEEGEEKGEDESTEDEMVEHAPSAPKFNPFDLLEAESVAEDSKEDPYAIINDTDDQNSVDTQEDLVESPQGKGKGKKGKSGSTKRGKSKKNASTHSKTKTTIDELSVEALDQLLQSVTFENASPNQKQAGSSSSSSDAKPNFLRIDAKVLNAENELVRVFGAHVVQQQQQQRPRNRQHHRTRPLFRKALLATPTDQWPPLESMGLSMEVANKPYYVYHHPPKFQIVQRQFREAVEILHPDVLLTILAMHPYHPDTLLMLSRIMEQSGDRAQARDLLQRAIYVLEKSAMASFAWTQPEARRLSYLDYPNRVLFLALFKNMQYLAGDACWRTALEWGKLLWSLEPEEDPLGCLFVLDYYALQSNSFDWMLTLIASLPNAWAYPNLAFGEVFAHYFMGKKEKAASLLLKASAMYPFISKKLCLQTNVLPGHLSEELYIARIQSSLLRNKELTDWVQSTLGTFRYPKPPLSSPPLSLQQLDALYRHTIVSDIGQQLVSSLPEHARLQTQFFDPYPPLHSRSPYTDLEPRRTGIPANAHPLLGMLTSLLPWNNDVTAPMPDTEVPLQALAAQMMGQIREMVNGLVPPPPPPPHPERNEAPDSEEAGGEEEDE